MRISNLAFAFPLFAASCALDGSNDSVESSTAELGRAGPIRGRNLTRHHLSNGGLLFNAVDLSATPIEAQVERGQSFEIHPGAGAADGSFVIEGVPQGASYWLRVGTNWYLTRERIVDVGGNALGRPDAVPAAAGTSLVFDVDGLTPVTAGDDFQIEAPDAQVGFYSTASSLNPIAANAPAPGDTVLAGAEFPFDQDPAAGTSVFPLIQASRGDTFTLAQLTTLPLGTLTYQSLSRALATPVEMTQGAATTIRGTMTAPPTLTTSVHHRQAAFEALADAVHPGTTAVGSAVLIDANPAGRVVNLGTPDLAIANLAAGSADQVLPLRYGNPYPAEWRRFSIGITTFRVPFIGPAPGGGTVTRQTSIIAIAWQFIDRDRVTVAPVISPPRAIEIDGERSDADVQVTAATPVLSWARPRLGRAAAYTIRINRLNEAAPFATSVARLVIDGHTRRIRIPAGLLQPGQHYNFQVRAVATKELRDDSRLEPAFVPPAGFTDAESVTIRVE
jgi:hypothetical protein